MNRLASLHHRFQRDKQIETAYSTVIQEYLDMGHMTKITTDHPTSNEYYLPHHGVIKDHLNISENVRYKNVGYIK